jgi:hypothetical protein
MSSFPCPPTPPNPNPNLSRFTPRPRCVPAHAVGGLRAARRGCAGACPCTSSEALRGQRYRGWQPSSCIVSAELARSRAGSRLGLALGGCRGPVVRWTACLREPTAIHSCVWGEAGSLRSPCWRAAPSSPTPRITSAGLLRAASDYQCWPPACCCTAHIPEPRFFAWRACIDSSEACGLEHATGEGLIAPQTACLAGTSATNTGCPPRPCMHGPPPHAAP